MRFFVSFRDGNPTFAWTGQAHEGMVVFLFFLEKLGEVFDPPEVIDTILVGELFGEIGQMTLFQKAFYLGSLVLFQRRLQLQIVYFTQNIL